MPAIAALAYHRASGRKHAQPNMDLSYSENYLYMLDAGATRNYKPNPRLARAIDIMFILHAEHEMNCSTAVGSWIFCLISLVSSLPHNHDFEAQKAWVLHTLVIGTASVHIGDHSVPRTQLGYQESAILPRCCCNCSWLLVSTILTKG